jgi:chorismate mutase
MGDTDMPSLSKYYLVEASALPTVFIKVAETIYSLETGKASTISEAVRQTGISRSAFYKYKDVIRPFYDAASNQMVTLHMTLLDKPGTLSQILDHFAKFGANILTINQSIPINGVASVTVSAETDPGRGSLEPLLELLGATPGVSNLEIIGR